MKSYNCWLTVMSSAYQDDIVAGFVSKGYMVSAADKDGKVVDRLEQNIAAHILAFTIYKKDGTGEAISIYKDVAAILADMRAFYYSIVIAAASESAWVGSNFNIPVEAPKEQTLPDKKDLN